MERQSRKFVRKIFLRKRLNLCPSILVKTIYNTLQIVAYIEVVKCRRINFIRLMHKFVWTIK